MNKLHQNGISEEIDWFLNRLAPLAKGRTVVLTLELPQRNAINFKNPLVTLAPGILFGFNPEVIVVSVIGKGSCIVHVRETKIAGLVRAGIPAKLASTLVEKLNILFKE